MHKYFKSRNGKKQCSIFQKNIFHSMILIDWLLRHLNIGKNLIFRKQLLMDSKSLQWILISISDKISKFWKQRKSLWNTPGSGIVSHLSNKHNAPYQLIKFIFWLENSHLCKKHHQFIQVVWFHYKLLNLLAIYKLETKFK